MGIRRPIGRLIVAILMLSVGAPSRANDKIELGLDDKTVVQARVLEFFEAVAERDIHHMESLWLTADNVSMLTPRGKRMSIGWPSVKKAFVEGVFTFWNRIEAAPNGPPMVLIGGTTATAWFHIDAVGENKAGQTVPYDILGSQTYQRHGGRWLLISCFASGAPE